ncbi:transglutaminase family protein [Oceanicoccus sp. KOV_DT_Chl]|uniref:transglutaminase family protein n=1 Tax=Oceanicoccus sp. KOV_DT_Chl TaxID=1904639 RepID=UPI000C7CCB89|nr:transglutaminase family protein [Oceanicoccus sp. KOV_DT_Chl]
MSIRVALKHSTDYRYSDPVLLFPQLIRLRPAPHCRTEIQHYHLNISPAEHLQYWQQDAFNNHILRVMFSQLISEFSIEVDIIANIQTINPFDFFIDDDASLWPLVYSAEMAQDLAPYLNVQAAGAEMQQFLNSLSTSNIGIVDFLLYVSQALLNRISYVERLEQGVQSCETSLSIGSGSCRDSAWLLVQSFRHLGVAARFVSGYSIQLAAADNNFSQDSTDLHAWTEVFIPGAGWIGIDPTSAQLTGEGYIPLCCTREPASAAPVSGNKGPGATQLFFNNSVTRLS